MPTYTYTLSLPASPATTATVARPYATKAYAPQLGFGLMRPLRRDQKGDFATGGGEEVVRSAVEQVLLTQCNSPIGQGEYPWRPEFGSVLQQLRHRSNDPVTEHLAQVYVAEALARWEPRVKLKEVTITREKSNPFDLGGEDVLVIGLRYDFISTADSGVSIQGVAQTIRLSA